MCHSKSVGSRGHSDVLAYKAEAGDLVGAMRSPPRGGRSPAFSNKPSHASNEAHYVSRRLAILIGPLTYHAQEAARSPDNPVSQFQFKQTCSSTRGTARWLQMESRVLSVSRSHPNVPRKLSGAS
ncbi:MAG: hypothetical protein JWQ49_187 [Edaphobacter sp.]|nr:hypothetical protein [Edaphobacter sp.]